MMAFVFSAMSMKAVGRAAGKMVDEVRRQFREIPGIMDGSGKPEYAKCVEISTAGAQKEMMVPSLMAIAVPLVVGVIGFGVPGVIGLLALEVCQQVSFLPVCLIMPVVHGIMRKSILKEEIMVVKKVIVIRLVLSVTRLAIHSKTRQVLHLIS